MDKSDIVIDIKPSAPEVSNSSVILDIKSDKPVENTEFRHSGPPIEPFVPPVFKTRLTEDNYKTKINQMLKLYNISDNIDNIYNYINSNFKGKLEPTLPIISNTFNYLGGDYTITGSVPIASGSYNSVYRATINHPRIKNVVIRYSMYNSREGFINSYNENLKHFILYLINRCNIGSNLQLLPQPLFFGLKRTKTENQYYMIMIMEAGDYTLQNLIQRELINLKSRSTKKTSADKLRKIFFSFYNALSLLNNEMDYFIHGDSKLNNMVIKNNKIMIIDLGFSKFKLFDLVFDSAELKGPKFTKHTQHNVNQDMIQLLTSIYIELIYNSRMKREKKDIKKNFEAMNYVFKKKKGIKYVQLSNSIIYNIFNNNVSEHFKIFTTDLVKTYKIFYTNNYINRIPLEYSINMTPKQMKKDFNISESEEDLYETYKQKYKKYKKKYLELKSSLRI